MLLRQISAQTRVSEEIVRSIIEEAWIAEDSYLWILLDAWGR